MAAATRARTARSASGRGAPSGPRPPAPADVPPTAAPIASASPRTTSRPGSIGPLRLQQFVLVEVAAAIVLAAGVVNKLLLVPAGVVGVVLVLLAVVTRHQQPIPEWLGTALALRRRQRQAAKPIDAGADHVFTPALECEPALRTYTFTDRERRMVGLVGDGTFLTAILQVDATDSPLRPHRMQRPLPLSLLRDAMDVDGIVLESVQVVQHALAAPAPHLSAQTVPVRNYGPLQEQTGAPAVRLTWVALKFNPELCSGGRRGQGRGPRGCAAVCAAGRGSAVEQAAGRGFRLDTADGGRRDSGDRHRRERQPASDGAGPADQHAQPAHGGEHPSLALRRPLAHHLLGEPVAAVGAGRHAPSSAGRAA